MPQALKFETYTVAWIAVLPIEAEAALGMLDQKHDGYFQSAPGDDYIYVGGEINGHNVVVATWPAGQNYGVGAAAGLVNQIKIRFPRIWFALLVGIAAGLPKLSPIDPRQRRDIRLGDVLVCVPEQASTGITHYDLGKDTVDGFQINGRQAETPAIVRSAISNIQLTKTRPFRTGNELAKILAGFQQNAQDEKFRCPSQEDDKLFSILDEESGGTTPTLIKRAPRDESERTLVWYGNIGSGNSLMKNPRRRDELRDKYNLIGLEMEAAGIMGTLPTGVVRGVCDYADGYKNDDWQAYAAAAAASYAKCILQTISPTAPISQEKTNEVFTLPRVLESRSGTTRTTVPFLRNFDFVGRSSVFQELDLQLHPTKIGAKRAALCGLGGVGKTQVALEYAYRFRDSHTCSTFWVYANSVSLFEESYQRIAQELEIPGHGDPKIDLLQLVRDWLEKRHDFPWLMIIDNVDDMRTLTDKGTNTKCLLEYIPQSRQGSVLYTSRNRDVGIDLAGEPITVSLMNQQEAQALLRSRMPQSQNMEEELTFLEEMGFLPFAITQAAAYMLKRRISIAQYLKLYHQSESNRSKLISHQFADHGRVSRPMESLAKTWITSFQFIKEQSFRSMEILIQMSFLDRSAIPNSLLIGECEDELDFLDAMAMLEAFALVERKTDTEFHDMHRLVQLATIVWVSEEGQKEDRMLSALSRLAERFPCGDYENLNACAAYLPHADAVLQLNFSSERDAVITQTATLLCNTSRYVGEQGHHMDSVERAQKSIELRTGAFGPTHVETLKSMNFLARALRRQGNYQQAEEIIRKNLAMQEKILGQDHEDTLDSLETLARLQFHKGEFKIAETTNTQVVRGRTKILGAKHRQTLSSMRYGGWLLRSQRLFELAKAQLSRVLILQSKVLGENHPDTLDTLGDLAMVNMDLGNYEEAESGLRKALAKAEVVFGTEHPDTYALMNNLAVVLSSKEKHLEAESLNSKQLLWCQTVLGEYHPNTLTALHNLALNWVNLQKYDQAEVLFRSALNAEKDVLGVDHVDTLSTSRGLANVLVWQAKFDEAAQLLEEVCEKSRRVLGIEHFDTLNTFTRLMNVLARQAKHSQAIKMCTSFLCDLQAAVGCKHPSTLTCSNILAQALHGQGQYKKAEVINSQTLRDRVEVLGDRHPDTLTSRNNLASVLMDQGRYKEAEDLYERTLRDRIEVLGDRHPDTLTSRNNLAIVLKDQGRYKEAEDLYEWILRDLIEVLGDRHPNTITSRNNLASVLRDQGRYKEAEDLYERTLRDRIETLGDRHPNTLTSRNNLINVLRDQGRYKEAEDLCRETLQKRREVLGDGHPDTLTSFDNLADVLYDQDEYSEAEDLYRQTLQNRIKVLGNLHPDTLTSRNNLANILYEQSKYEEAEIFCYQTLAERREVLGDRHPETLRSRNNLAILLRDQGKYNEAEGLFRQALQGRVEVLGDTHPDTINSRNNLADMLSDQLQEASAQGELQVVQTLLEKGADVNGRGGEENGTALHAASAQGHQQVVQLLLDRGADVHMEGEEHGTALRVASDGGHERIVQILLRHVFPDNQDLREAELLRSALLRGDRATSSSILANIEKTQILGRLKALGLPEFKQFGRNRVTFRGQNRQEYIRLPRIGR